MFFKRIAFLTILIVLTAAMLILSGCAAVPTVDKIKEDGKIIMYTNAAFPPFEYIKNGEIVGVDVDIAREIARDLGVELEIQNIDFDSVVGAIKSGKGSMGLAGMSITEDRLKNVDFSIEYAESSLFIIVKGDNDTIKNADDLAGKKIGVQTGTTADTLVTDIEDAAINRYKNFLEAALDLKNGKVDAIVVDELPAGEIIANNSDLKKLEEPLSDEKFAVCIKKGNDTLIDAVNATLERLIGEGKIQEFINNHVSAAAGE